MANDQLKNTADEVGNVAKQTLQQTIQEVKSFGSDQDFDGTSIPKTSQGIRVSIIGAFIFFCGYFGGYTPLLLVLAYVFLVEKNEWLGALTIKALMLSIFFSIVFKILNLPGDALSVIANILATFGGNMSTYRLTSIFSAARTVVDWFEFLIFTLSALSALRYKPVNVPFADKIFKKYM